MKQYDIINEDWVIVFVFWLAVYLLLVIDFVYSGGLLLPPHGLRGVVMR